MRISSSMAIWTWDFSRKSFLPSGAEQVGQRMDLTKPLPKSRDWQDLHLGLEVQFVGAFGEDERQVFVVADGTARPN